MKKYLYVIFIAAIIILPDAASSETESPDTIDNTGKETTVSIGKTETISAAVSGDGIDFSDLTARSAQSTGATLGSLDKTTGYKFALELVNRGAAIKNATLSGFDDRTPGKHAPLLVLSPVETPKGQVLTLANTSLFIAPDGAKDFPTRALPLNKLNWQPAPGASPDSATFTADITDGTGKKILKLTKTYRIAPGTYDVLCTVRLENLSDQPLQAKLQIQGPAGINNEDIGSISAPGSRSIVAGFAGPDNKVETIRMENTDLRKRTRNNDTEKLKLAPRNSAGHFLWAASTNKYFAAILRPVPSDGDWSKDTIPGPAEYYDSNTASKSPAANENISFSVYQTVAGLAPKGLDGSSRQFSYQLYVGPKDKSLFSQNALYRKLGYIQTISMKSCCCPQGMIAPIAFGIMQLMKWLHVVVPNYGVVIIILVFLVRILLHPITRKSQIAMVRMQKLSPQVEQIKAKCGSDKSELNKQMIELYRREGASPVWSFLPMLLQMPIWIALWTAIYTGIELRDQKFLPWWITDLSAPDALIRFNMVTIPLLGWQIDSLNLIPILMGAVMYLQQKMTPQPAAAQTNPQLAMQQKMMMIMMPFLFPLMLYKWPSGVNLYIMASTAAGVVEQIIIRRHLEEKQAQQEQGLIPATAKTGGKIKKKKPKPFFKDH